MKIVRLFTIVWLPPLSFDFVNFLACAASFVQAFGLSKFHVDVDTTEFRKWGQVETDYTDEYRERKAKNIFIDILKCCPFVSSFRYGRDLRNDRLSRFYFFPYRIKKRIKTFTEFHTPLRNCILFHLKRKICHIYKTCSDLMRI